MVAESKNQNDDFFNLIAQEQKIENPFAQDEIIFRDESGKLKILKAGAVLDFDQKSDSSQGGTGSPERQAIKKTAGIKADEVKSGVLARPAVKPLVKTGRPLNIEKEVDEIVKKSGINFPDPDSKKRFRNIIISRLKDIRDQIETREMLLKSPLVGGMGFDDAKSDRILAIINQEFEQLNGELREKVSRDPFSELRAEANELLKQPLVVQKPKPSVPVFTPNASQPAKSSFAPEKIEAATAVKPAQDQPAVTAKSPVFVRPIVPESGKPKIEDVRFSPKLTGPVEEIKTMTLTDFRRLGSNPKEAVEKILAKIDLLEDESFSKRVEAVKAWRESEVNRLYLKLGDQSMEEKKPISEIMAQCQRASQPALTEEELEAIIELNQRLRY